MNELTNRIFKLWAYTVSHSFLILRSPQKFPDQDDYDKSNDYNIDIEFSAVAYLDIPHLLKGISLTEITDDIPNKFSIYKQKLGYKVFKLKSQGKDYYIVASSYMIGKSKWISEDRISNMHLEYDEIINSSR